MSTPADYKPKLPRLLRRLTLSHDGEPFLDRWGIVWDRLGGFYVHKIRAADPGLDMHDHPWSFVTLVVRGGYCEDICESREAAWPAYEQVSHVRRYWGRWSIHVMPLHIAHRINGVDPGTVTIVLRGPTRRPWGFFPPYRWVHWERYDYGNRRPSSEVKAR